MRANDRSTVIRQLKSEFYELGYVNGLLRENYAFADVLGPEYTTKRISLAAFSQDPPSYRNAAFGVAIGNGHSGPAFVQEHGSLGAPQILEIDGEWLHRWKVVGWGKPTLLETVASDDISGLFARHKNEWSPQSILRAKSSRNIATQLDFLDLGLMPLLDKEVRRKLDELLDGIIVSAISTFEKNARFEQEHYAPLFRLVFRLIAAKLLADRGHPGEWTSRDPQSAVRAVEEFYFDNDEPERVLSDSQTQQIIWQHITDAFHFQNLSVDSLAFVYEHTLVSRDIRKSLGIHSTPREIAEYIVRRLPFEELERDELRVFEPFSGHSVFLVAAMQRLRELLPAEIDPKRRHQYFVEVLSGIEIDEFAREVAKLSLMLADYPNPDGWHLIGSDAFDSPSFERELRRASVVLCNPPFEDFKPAERARYKDLRSTSKPVEILLRVLDDPPKLLGFVLPRVFINGQQYRRVREKLDAIYSTIELLSLPDHVFRHSEAETVLLMAWQVDTQSLPLITGEVTKSDLLEFYSSGRPSFEDEICDKKSRSKDTWQPQRLRKLWDATKALRRFGELADIHRGIEYKKRLDRHRAELFSSKPGPGFARGIPATENFIRPYTVTDSVFLCTAPDQLKGNAIEHAWRETKLFVNSARRSRGPWTLTAAIDDDGLICYQNIHGVWPRRDLRTEVAAAVLNGPVASAFVNSFEIGRHVRIVTLKQVPVPDLDKATEDQIISLVREYLEYQHNETPRLLGVNEADCRSAELLATIDALVLRAYGLPPPREKELLDFFGGYERIDAIEARLIDINTVDSSLRSVLGSVQTSHSTRDDSLWSEEVSAAVYRHGTVAVYLLRQYWQEGLLLGRALAGALEELGYSDERSSHTSRCNLLVEALSASDSGIRHAAAQGLVYLADCAAIEGLAKAYETEQNALVKAQIEDAIARSRLTT